jgi:hypothetical protein
MTDMNKLADELEGLAERATPGEWAWTDDNGVAFPRQWRLCPGVLFADGTSGTPGGDSIDCANAALIVALRNRLPAILSALRDAGKMREALGRISQATVYDDERDSGTMLRAVKIALAALKTEGE